MAWCHQATSHYLSQYELSRSLPAYDVTRPQWVIHKRTSLVASMTFYMPRSILLMSLLPGKETYPRPRQNGCHFADDSFKYIFLNGNAWIVIRISLKFIPKGQINNFPALVEIMVWRRSVDKPLSQPMMVNLLTNKCFTRPHWVNPVDDSGTWNVINYVDGMSGSWCQWLLCSRW